TTFGDISKTTQVWPPLISRRTIFAPILPRPTMPICIFNSFVRTVNEFCRTSLEEVSRVGCRGGRHSLNPRHSPIFPRHSTLIPPPYTTGHGVTCQICPAY